MIFKINFFLFAIAMSTIWSYMLVYARYYANITNIQYSYLAMFLPVIVLVAKPVACSVTDAHGIHRQVLIGSLMTFCLSFSILGIIPFFKDPNDHENDNLVWIIIMIIYCIGNGATAVIFCMNDALASNYARRNNISYSRMRIWGNIGWAIGAFGIMIIGDVSWLPFRVPGCIILTAFSALDMAFLILWPYPEDFEMFHDGSTVEQRKLSIVGPNTMALIAQRKSRPSISKDMLERIRMGRSKSVGMLPGTVVAKEQLPQFEEPKEKKRDEKEYTNFQIQMLLMKMIAKDHKSFSKYILLFIIFGVIQSMIWSYQFDFLKVTIAKDEADFEFLSTFAMIAQSFAGEVLINAVAGSLLKWFGANANMSLALVTIGMRAYCYGNLLPHLNWWFVLVTEALQGPSLGLYWILIVDIGSNFALMVTDYIPELKRRGIVRDAAHEAELSGCLRATMIGVMSSSMEGLGVAIGAYLGGVLSTKLGYIAMFNICAIVAISIGFLNIFWELLNKLVLKSKSKKSLQSQNNHLGIPSIVIDESAKATRM